MSETMLITQAADDSDLIAAFAALRAASVPLRPGFVAELRACLQAEIAQTHEKRVEVTPYVAICEDGIVQRGWRPHRVRALGVDLRRVRGPADSRDQSTRAGRDPGRQRRGWK